MSEEGFVTASALSELEEDTPKRVELDGTPVSLVRTEGEVLRDQRHLLARQRVALRGRGGGLQIECWLHGSRFDLRTGKPSGPARHRAPSPYTP